MKQRVLLFAGLLILAVLFSGCTSQPAPAPVTQAPAAATPQATVTHMATTSLIGTDWKLGWYDDTKGTWSKVIQDSTITAKFSSDGKVTGFSGCSDYDTKYELGDAPQIWIVRPAVSTKVCQTPTGVMGQESAYFTDLEWAKTYAIKDGQLLIFDKTQKKILQFDST
jgi:heat shock protein HslJ